MLNSDSSPGEVLDQAESSFSSSHPQPRKPLETTRIKKRDSNQELLEYLKTADERFMAHAKELNTAILNKMDEATNSMLGLLGRMVALMEEQQGNKPWTQDSFCTLNTHLHTFYISKSKQNWNWTSSYFINIHSRFYFELLFCVFYYRKIFINLSSKYNNLFYPWNYFLCLTTSTPPLQPPVI